MPNIKSNKELCNNYNEISSFFHEIGEPIFITKNGRGDLAVMSIDLFNKFMGRYELYQLLEQSESDFVNGRTLTFDDSIKSLREELKKVLRWIEI